MLEDKHNLIVNPQNRKCRCFTKPVENKKLTKHYLFIWIIYI